ncbi:serpin-Z2A [Cyclospora cayetanensis]|uniref:Serpin-Z2A n=1 Tax=Cyclospora cayetanensis TaxID=88456 RepID=A0A6P6RQQ6_9EIME|nr:serpin-Z2A [Cyclospora cayetanensis]
MRNSACILYVLCGLLAAASPIVVAASEKESDAEPKDLRVQEDSEARSTLPAETIMPIASPRSPRRGLSTKAFAFAAALGALVLMVAAGVTVSMRREAPGPPPVPLPEEQPPPPPQQPEELPEVLARKLLLPEGPDKTAAARLVGAFFKYLDDIEMPNSVFSPVSVLSVLSVVAEGASWPVEERLRGWITEPAVYTLPEDLEGWPHRDALKALQDYYGPESPVIDMIAELCVDEDIRDTPGFAAFEKRVSDRLGYSPIRSMDFTQVVRTTSKINARVKTVTRGKIEEFLHAPMLVGASLVLVNAFYMKSEWASTFLPELTRQGTFKASTPFGVTNKRAKFMEQVLKPGSYHIYQEEGVTVLGLPYKYPGAAMYIYLPEDAEEFRIKINEDPTHLSRLVAKAREASVSGTGSSAATTPLKLRLPKFHLKTYKNKVGLSDLLGNLGLGEFLLWEQSIANLGLPPGGRVTGIFHQADLQIDEEGTEAAAATVAMQPEPVSSSPDAIELSVDRTFFFEVRLERGPSAEQDLTLLAGKISDPSLLQ